MIRKIINRSKSPMKLVGLYALTLSILKLSGVLLLPWWVVTSPVWGFVLVVALGFIAAKLFKTNK